MPRHHHVNLAFRPGQLDDQMRFLVEVLGYRELDLTADTRARAPRARWFEAEDGSQIHLSEDRDHRPAQAAHVAVEYDLDELALVEQRLASRSIAFSANDGGGGSVRVLILNDPAGNRWELRGPAFG